MPCYNPTFIHKRHILINGDTGEFDTVTKFIGSLKKYPDDHELIKRLGRNYSGSSCNVYVDKNTVKEEYIQIPCGKCIGCRIDYARSWADRLTYHALESNYPAYFVTLTYDDDHLDDLPLNNDFNVSSLCFDDMTKFIKDLRNKFRHNSIDYYYSGEYGDLNFRPHFHLILFGVELLDLKFWKLNSHGSPIYTSDTLCDLWKKGFVTLSDFTWTNAAYTARYVEKKRDGRLGQEYEALGLSPEACRCSRRPGIAYDYYMKHFEELWHNEGLNVSRDVNSSGKLGICRYFKKLAVKEGHYKLLADYNKLVLDRSLLERKFKVDNSSFDLARVREMLEFEERSLLNRQVKRSF